MREEESEEECSEVNHLWKTGIVGSKVARFTTDELPKKRYAHSLYTGKTKGGVCLARLFAPKFAKQHAEA